MTTEYLTLLTADGKHQTHSSMVAVKGMLEETEHQMALDGLTDCHQHRLIVECVKKQRELYDAITAFVQAE